MKIPGVMASLTNAIAYIDNIFQLYVIERACYESRRPQPFPYNCEQPARDQKLAILRHAEVLEVMGMIGESGWCRRSDPRN